MDVKRFLQGRLTVTAREVQRITGRNNRTVTEWIRTGAVRSVKIGRSRLIVAESLLEQLGITIEPDIGSPTGPTKK